MKRGITRALGIAAALIIGAVVGCVSPGPSEEPVVAQVDLPHFTNAIVYRGVRLAIPDGWLFAFGEQTVDLTDSIHFADPALRIWGAVEFVDFDAGKTGLEWDRFLADLEALAGRRADHFRWSTHTAGAQDYRVLEEYRGQHLRSITALRPAESGERSSAGGLPADAVVVRVHSIPQVGDSSAFTLAARGIINSIALADRAAHARTIAPALHFSRQNSDWHWFADVRGGAIWHRVESNRQPVLAGIWREGGEQPTLHDNSLYALFGDQPLEQGVCELMVAGSLVELEYRSFFADPGANRRIGAALFVSGSFEREGDPWGLFLRRGYPDGVVPEADATAELLADPAVQVLFAFLLEIPVPPEGAR